MKHITPEQEESLRLYHQTFINTMVAVGRDDGEKAMDRALACIKSLLEAKDAQALDLVEAERKKATVIERERILTISHEFYLTLENLRAMDAIKLLQSKIINSKI